jgi:Zn-dependent metalloprotease
MPNKNRKKAPLLVLGTLHVLWIGAIWAYQGSSGLKAGQPFLGGSASSGPSLKTPDVPTPRGTGLVKPGQSVRLARVTESKVVRTERYQHYIDDIEVIGSFYALHFPVAKGAPQSGVPSVPQVQGQVQDRLIRLQLDTQAAFTKRQALILAQKLTGIRDFESPELKILPGSSRQEARLIYRLETAESGTVFIDAHSGALVANLSSSENLSADIHVISAKNQGYYRHVEKLNSDSPASAVACELISLQDGGLLNLDAEACEFTGKQACQVLPPKEWSGNLAPLRFNFSACAQADALDPAALRAEENAKKFLDYFERTHSRDSYDDRGSAVVSAVHVGIGMDTARWYRKSKVLAYGDGDGIVTGDYTWAVDVAGHELTHGVIEASAGLVSMGESGAISESLADFFGEMIEKESDWKVGKKLFIHNQEENAVRDLADPHRLMGSYFDPSNGPQKRAYPGARSEMAEISYPCVAGNDQCAIHFNATIPGHAWFLIHESLGKAKAEALLYLALTQYFGERPSFGEAAQDVLQACEFLLNSSDCAQVKEIFFSTQMIST